MTVLADVLSIVKNHVVLGAEDFCSLCLVSNSVRSELADCPVSLEVKIDEIPATQKIMPTIVELNSSGPIVDLDDEECRGRKALIRLAPHLKKLQCRIRPPVLVPNQRLFEIFPVLQSLDLLVVVSIGAGLKFGSATRPVWNLGSLLELRELTLYGFELLDSGTNTPALDAELETTPPKLEKLVIHKFSGFKKLEFPSTLRELSLWDVPHLNPELSNRLLPANLKVLFLCQVALIILELPPKLQELRMFGKVTFTCENLILPETLTMFQWRGSFFNNDHDNTNPPRSKCAMLDHIQCPIPIVIPPSFWGIDCYECKLAGLTLPDGMRGIEMDDVSFPYTPGYVLRFPRYSNYIHAEALGDIRAIEFDERAPRVLDLRDIDTVPNNIFTRLFIRDIDTVKVLRLPEGVRDVRLTEMVDLEELYLPSTLASLRLEKVHALKHVSIPNGTKQVSLVQLSSLERVTLPVALEQVSLVDLHCLQSIEVPSTSRLPSGEEILAVVREHDQWTWTCEEDRSKRVKLTLSTQQ